MVYDRHQLAGLRWRVLGASLAAWAVMLAVPAWSGDVLPASLCSSAGATAGITANTATGIGIGIGATGTGTGIAGTGGIGMTSVGTTTAWLTADWLVSAGLGWMLMIVAMMLPMSIPALAHIRLSTFAHVRWRAMALFLAGYGAVWLLAGWVMKAIDMLLRNAATDLHLTAVATAAVLALVWQVSPAKQRCLNRCHDHRPLAAFGWPAARDALGLGLRHGTWCVGSCWALMLLVLLLPQGHVAGMVAAAVLMYGERLDPPRPPAWRLRGLKSAGLWLRREWAWRKQGAPFA
jgi:predicted metal-binding membrane protein